MKLTGESKFFIGIILVTLLIVVAGIVLMSRPAQTFSKSDLIPASAHTYGNKDAKVYLVEFSDFQCPACGSFYPVVKDITEKNKDELLFVYRHFPLTQHPQAMPAALASEAAAEQGKFWEMHDYLFENQDSLDEAMIIKGAEELGLDKDKFEKAFKDKKYEDVVTKDIADGNRFGVNSTPTFFLNGQKLTLNSQSDLEKAVSEAIKSAQ